MTDNTTPAEAVIIIPHHNDVTRLKLCLETLLPQTKGRPVEIVVVDNASTVDISDVKSAFPEVRFLDQPQKGAGLARNMGVSQTSALRLFFTDSDCVPDGNWVATAFAIGDEDKITGGPVKTFDEDARPKTGAQAFETVFAFPFEDYIKRQKFTGTGNLITTRAVFDATGPFRAGGLEDKVWCHQAGALGYKVHWEPDLLVHHPTRKDFAALRRKWKANTRAAYVLSGAGLTNRLLWFLRAVVVAASGVAHQIKVFRHPDLTIGEKLAAGFTLLRLRWLRAVWMLGQLRYSPQQRQDGQPFGDV